MKAIIPSGRVATIIEAWLNDNFGDLQTITSADFPNSIIYYHNNKAIVDYDRVSKFAYVSYDDIWWFLTSMFDLEPHVVAKILKKWLSSKYKIDINGVYDIATLELSDYNIHPMAEGLISEERIGLPERIKITALKWLDHTYGNLRRKYSLNDDMRIFYIDSNNTNIIEYNSRSGCAWVEEYMYSFLMSMFDLSMGNAEFIIATWLKTALGFENVDYDCIDIDPSENVALI